VLLNGDQIFPAQLAAIRSARETIRRPSTSGGGQAPDDGSAERLRRSRFVRWWQGWRSRRVRHGGHGSVILLAAYRFGTGVGAVAGAIYDIYKK